MYRFRVLEESTLCAPLVPLVEFFTALHCWEIETIEDQKDSQVAIFNLVMIKIMIGS